MDFFAALVEVGGRSATMGVSGGAVQRARHSGSVTSGQPGGVPGPIRVLIVACQGLLREALRVLLTREDGIEIVGEIAHGIQTMGVIDEVRPHVVLIDVCTPGSDGIELIRMIRRSGLKAKPLVLCPDGDDAAVFNVLKAGAKGYLSTNASLSDLRKAIRGLHRGEEWVERKLLLRFLGGDALADVRLVETHERTKRVLTAREREVLRFLASGGTNKDIAEALFITEKTVKTHLTSIFRKLNVARRLQAVLYAVQQGLR